MSLIVFATIGHTDYAPVDQYANNQYLKQSYMTEDNKIIPIARYGNRQNTAPSYQAEKDGRINEIDHFGNRQFHDYKTQGDKMVPIDRYGNNDYSRSIYQKK